MAADYPLQNSTIIAKIKSRNLIVGISLRIKENIGDNHAVSNIAKGCLQLNADLGFTKSGIITNLCYKPVILYNFEEEINFTTLND